MGLPASLVLLQVLTLAAGVGLDLLGLLKLGKPSLGFVDKDGKCGLQIGIVFLRELNIEQQAGA